VWWQFLVESVLLSAGGGVLGAALGAAVTVGYALSRDWTVVVPGTAVAAGLVASVLSGAVAGIYPAAQAARMAPAEALRAV
jgi:putative ABC transport system permease protein